MNYDFQNYGEDECSKVNKASNSIFADHSTLLVGYIQYDLNSEKLRWKIKYIINN